MLPTSAAPRSPSGRRAAPPLRWRSAALVLVALVLGFFVWAQYTVLSSNLTALARPAVLASPRVSSSSTRPLKTRQTKHEKQHDERLRHKKSTPPRDDPNVFSFGELGDEGALGKRQRTTLPPVAYTPRPSEAPAVAVSASEQVKRQAAVVDAMRFAWKGYEQHAFGADEVDPKYGLRREDVWGGMAVSLVDGMDTLWVMGLRDEFARAREYVATQLRFDHVGKDGDNISVFETIIREVGGLLSAFALSRDDVFKRKAVELMDVLEPAFSEDEGVFYTLFNPHTKERTAHIADVGTLQLEMRYLSDITGDPKYATMGDAFYAILQREGSFNHTGLFPVHFDATLGTFHTYSSITFGALGDSFYEYLLKVHIYSGQRREDAYLRALYDDAVAGLEAHLLQYSAEDDLFYLQELSLPSMSGMTRMDHLLCFVPGMLALGTLFETHDAAKNARHLALAEKLMQTCYEMYRRQPTGLAPDIVVFPHMLVRDAKYKLRPEAVESLFYLFRVTKDVRYRNYGWAIFEAIEAHAKLKFGYGAIQDVRELPARKDNKMESFFLAETLKYHYLLQSPDDVLPLDEFVFNTEAHPLPIRKRTVAPAKEHE